MRNLQKTATPNQADMSEQWYHLDATDMVLGRLSTRVATLLRGKHEPTFAPHVPTKNHVVITNAAKVRVTGNKLAAKMYYTHSSRPGSLKERNLAEQLEKRPTYPVEKAIERMLPDNKLRRIWMTHLHVYPAADHPHQAQKPVTVSIEGTVASSGPKVGTNG